MLVTANSVRVKLPKSLRDYWSGVETVEVAAATLAEALAALDARFPGLGARILDDQGHVRPYVHVFVNQDAVSNERPEKVALSTGDTIHILPSVAGGFLP
ncbi:MAG: MoaD/ThiS family protein [Thermoplasmatota archaeon]